MAKSYHNGFGPAKSTPMSKPKRKSGKLGGTANKPKPKKKGKN